MFEIRQKVFFPEDIEDFGYTYARKGDVAIVVGFHLENLEGNTIEVELPTGEGFYVKESEIECC